MVKSRVAEPEFHREQAPEFEQTDCVAETPIAMAEERLGQQGALREALERWEAEPDRRKVTPFYMAVGYVQLADRERALGWLELQYERLPADLLHMKAVPFADPLHGHPRFQKLLAKLGLADPQ